MRRALAGLLAAVALSIATSTFAFAAGQPPVNLGTSSTYGVLARRLITNVGTTYVTGDLGTHNVSMPEPSIIVSGTRNQGNPAGQQAVVDLEAAIVDAAGRGPATTLLSSGGNGNLGGRTLLPGVYENHGTEPGLSLRGTLTLDAQGDPNAVWVFQGSGVNESLETSAGSHVVLINGARFCRVFWQVADVTLGTDSEFEGHVLSEGSITAGRGARIRGQLMALGNIETGGNISLDNNRIDNSICATWTPSLPKTGYPPAEPSIPWTSALAALAAAFALSCAGAFVRTRRRDP
jgi:hypothetical protein